MKFDSILFDMDWVLVDSFEWHFNALEKAMQDFWFTLTLEEFKQYEWLSTMDKIKCLSNIKSIPQNLFDSINKKKQKYTQENIDEWCKINSEKLFMFQNIKKLGLKTACCSSSKKESVINILTKLWIIDYFDLIISSDDVQQQKPNPHIYLKAMELLWTSSEKCIIVEDSDIGIQAAQSAWWLLIKVTDSRQVIRWLFENILK